MSFSKDLKEELSKLTNLNNKDIVKFELIGYLISSNTQIVKNKIKYVTESEYNINRFGKLLSNLDLKDFKIEVIGKKYMITLKKIELKEIEYNNSVELKTQELEIDVLEKALIRGVFLGSGYINNPEKKYHMELSLSSLNNFQAVYEILNKYDINTKKIERNKNICVYIMEGESISQFLAFIGAAESVIRFEEIRVIRDMKNSVNRLVNCETFNLNKTINIAIKQIEDIEFLKKIGVFQKLNNNLKETAEMRLKNPEMSLTEIGQSLRNKVGKSGVNYRLKKISDLAKDFRRVN